MIDKLKIKNLKSINKLEMYLRNFNIFTGTNSSGKSTTIQALLLIAQNLENGYGLNGPLVTIGEFREVKNYNVNDEKILISVYDSSEENEVELSISEDGISILKNDEKLTNKLNFANNKFHYLSCNRIGIKDIFHRNRTLYDGVGINGEYAMDYLSKFKLEPVDTELIKDHSNYTLLAQVNWWLNYIVSATVRVESIIGTDAIKAEYGIVDGRYSRPQNVGSGISYLISILVMGLSSNKEDIIIIENPEIHLHPLSQSRLCEFLYFVSHGDRQVIIETHSDHFFNAIRAGIATNEMKKEDILIEFFKLGSDNCTREYDISIGKYGAVENPIPNLFDQFQLDMDKMLGI